MFRYLVLLLFGISALQLVSGCEKNANTPEEGEQNVVERTKPQSVEERAREKWDAMAAGNWKKVYSFLSPGIRKVQSEEEFSGRMQRSALAYKRAEVRGAVCQEEACDLSIKVFYVYQGVIQAMQGVELDSLVHEKWIRKNGQWWWVDE